MLPSPRDVRMRPSPFRSMQVLYSNGAFRYSPVGLGVPSAFERVPPTMRPIRVGEPHCVLMPSRIARLRLVAVRDPDVAELVHGRARRVQGAVPAGAVRYSPRMTPVSTSMRTRRAAGGVRDVDERERLGLLVELELVAAGRVVVDVQERAQLEVPVEGVGVVLRRVARPRCRRRCPTAAAARRLLPSRSPRRERVGGRPAVAVADGQRGRVGARVRVGVAEGTAGRIRRAVAEAPGSRSRDRACPGDVGRGRRHQQRAVLAPAPVRSGVRRGGTFRTTTDRLIDGRLSPGVASPSSVTL